MTVKEALEKAIEIIESLDSSGKSNDNNDELISVLQKLKKDYPYWKLTEDIVLDMVEQYCKDHNGRLPYVSDFNGKALPSPSVIKRIFKVDKVSDFLDKVYPQRNSNENLIYNGRKRCEWLEEFKKMYLKFEKASILLRPTDYEREKEEEAPGLKLIYRWIGINSYNQLLKFCGLEDAHCYNVNVVNANDASVDKMENIIEVINEINESEKNRL